MRSFTATALALQCKGPLLRVLLPYRGAGLTRLFGSDEDSLLHSVHQPTWALLATSKLWTCLEMARTVAASSSSNRILDPFLPIFIWHLLPCFAICLIAKQLSTLARFHAQKNLKDGAETDQEQPKSQPRLLPWWHHLPCPTRPLSCELYRAGKSWDQH